jgi:transcription elongation factor Elf1
MGRLDQYQCPNCRNVSTPAVVSTEHHRHELRRTLRCKICKYTWSVSQEKILEVKTH